MFNKTINILNTIRMFGKRLLELSLILLFLGLHFNCLLHETTQPESRAISNLRFDSDCFMHTSHLSAGNVPAALCNNNCRCIPGIRYG